MLQTCLGVYFVVALFTFLVVLGPFLDSQTVDEEMPNSS